MTTVTMSSLIADIRQYAYNPAGVQKVIFNALDACLDGSLDIVDAANPFVYTLSATAASVTAFLQENESRTRRLYPSTALINEDLYFHMSDKDYVNRFALPTQAKIEIIIQKAPLLEALVYDPASGNSLLIIPRNTQFVVNATTFSMQYPVEIRELSHGGLQITYLNDKPSPLRALGSNMVPWEEFTDTEMVQGIRLTVDTDQFYITTAYQDISTSAGFVTSVPLTDQFYYVRCYLQNATTLQWMEILTTHSDQIYDPFTVTAVIKVLSDQIRVTIPVVYATMALASGKLRIDVYETKGSLSMQLSNYTPSEYSAKWYSADDTESTDLTTAINNVNNLMMYSMSFVDGGRNALTFSELKTRVVDNSVGAQVLPITTAQLESGMRDLGYAVVKHIDTLTDRVFLATRKLPAPTNPSILTPVSTAMLSVKFSMVQSSDWVGTFNNGDSVTLTSSALYKYDNGVTTPVTIAELNTLLSQPLAKRCNTITTAGYFYSPFTYVLDASTELFESRPYYLDAPDVITRDFVASNQTLTPQAGLSSAYTLKRTTTGYELYIQTQSTQVYQDLDDSLVGARLSMISPNQASRVTVLGVLHQKDTMTKERTFKFVLTSNFNIDALDQMEFPSIVGTGNGLTVKLSLLQNADLLLTTTAPTDPNYVPIPADSFVVSDSYTAQRPVVITQERLGLQFGQALKTLWNQCRSAVAPLSYQTYPADVPARWSEDVYALDPNTGTRVKVVNNKVVYTITHHKGDPILNADNTPVLLHRAGDMILDNQGQPIPSVDAKRYMTRYVDVTAFSGAYYFTTDTTTKAYLTTLVAQLIEWITKDLPAYQDFLLEQTRIYFHPKVTAGSIRVLDSQNQQTYIPASQSLTVKLYVPAKVFNDPTLRTALNRTTILKLQELLASPVVAVSALETELKATYGPEVIDIEISGLGGTQIPHTVLSVLDAQSEMTLGKRLVALEDNTLLVQEAVDIKYVLHGN